MRERFLRQAVSAPTARQAGVSLIELMVAIALSMIIMGALAVVFAGSSRTRDETEKTSQQIENGRYATQLLVEDLRLAGYYGEFTPGSLTPPATLPDPAQTDAVSLAEALVLPVQGYDGGAGMPVALAALLGDRRAGADVLVIRRASTCVAGAAGCAAVDMTRNTYFQTALCSTQLTELPSASHFLIGTTASEFTTSNPAISAAPTFLARKDCLTAAALRAYYTRIYFVTNNNAAGDGIPTLKMAELGAGAFAITPLVEGVDQLQFEYGLDSSGDGTPELYKPNPADVAEWGQATTVRIHLLAMNTLRSPGFTDNRSYVLGAQADGSANSFGPYADARKRHAYTTLVRLNNIAGRLE